MISAWVDWTEPVLHVESPDPRLTFRAMLMDMRTRVAVTCRDKFAESPLSGVGEAVIVQPLSPHSVRIATEQAALAARDSWIAIADRKEQHG